MYEFQPYPSWRYHRDGREQLIHTDAEHEALHAEGWRDTPAAFLTQAKSTGQALSPDKSTDATTPVVSEPPAEADAPAEAPTKKKRK